LYNLEQIMADGRTRKQYAKDSIKNQITVMLRNSISQITGEYNFFSNPYNLPDEEDPEYNIKFKQWKEEQSKEFNINLYPEAFKLIKEAVEEMKLD
jgi:hypothetical protein